MQGFLFTFAAICISSISSVCHPSFLSSWLLSPSVLLECNLEFLLSQCKVSARSVQGQFPSDIFQFEPEHLLPPRLFDGNTVMLSAHRR